MPRARRSRGLGRRRGGLPAIPRPGGGAATPPGAPRDLGFFIDDSGEGTGDAAGDALVPERLGEFRLVRPLGQGGMGVVYLGVQESLGREVAIKLVRFFDLHDRAMRRRFQREVEVAARLQHPGIVPIYTVGEERGIPYFAMKRIQGCTLARGEPVVRCRFLPHSTPVSSGWKMDV